MLWIPRKSLTLSIELQKIGSQLRANKFPKSILITIILLKVYVKRSLPERRFIKIPIILHKSCIYFKNVKKNIQQSYHKYNLFMILEAIPMIFLDLLIFIIYIFNVSISWFLNKSNSLNISVSCTYDLI